MKKAIFLDRDGTIIKFRFPITQECEIELLPDAAKAVRAMNQAGYLVIIVTNQPVIAMNICSEERLDELHSYIRRLFEEQGAHIDGFYYCPHYDMNVKNAREEYICQCTCRKPQPGLILKAAEDFDIDLSRSFMVGDTLRDVEAGVAAGCKSIFVKSGAEEPLKPEAEVYDDIYDFVKKQLV